MTPTRQDTINDGLARLNGESLGPPTTPEDAISVHTAAFARVLVAHPEASPIPLVHAITAPAALQNQFGPAWSTAARQRQSFIALHRCGEMACRGKVAVGLRGDVAELVLQRRQAGPSAPQTGHLRGSGLRTQIDGVPVLGCFAALRAVACAPMSKGEIPALTGLRGLAALLVVLGHYSTRLVVMPRAEVPNWFWGWTGALPGIGMSIFFTLSGFVIALSYSGWDWRERPGHNLMRLFFYRFARLYPAFVLFALLIIFVTPSLRDFSSPDAQAYLMPHLLLLQSWWPAKFGGQLVSGDAFHVSWSLSAEAGLYLMFGLGAAAVAVLPFRRPTAIAAAFFGTWIALLWLAWVYRQELKPPAWSDSDWYLWLYGFSPWGVAVQFGMGVLAWHVSRNVSDSVARKASILGALGLAAIYVACATASVTSHVEQSIVAGLSVACVMVGSRVETNVTRWLSGRRIVYIGTVSYSLYLFHFAVPNMGIGGDVFQTMSPAALLYWLVTFAMGLGFAVMLATGVYQLVEVPGRRLIRRAADELLGITRLPQAEKDAAPLKAGAGN